MHKIIMVMILIVSSSEEENISHIYYDHVSDLENAIRKYWVPMINVSIIIILGCKYILSITTVTTIYQGCPPIYHLTT